MNNPSFYFYLYLVFQLLFMVCFILLGAVIQNKKEKKLNHEKNITVQNISVIVPFRNEENRINELLSSYLNSKTIPSEIVFVNDHSSDNCEKKINEKIGHLPIKIISLNGDEIGKKCAIKKGILLAKNDFILTQDADVYFSKDYFSNLEDLNQIHDMIVMPVKFSSNKILNIDVALANALNHSSSGIYKPIMASGANLLFKKKSYVKYGDIKAHKNILSGDDAFLLKAFTDNKLNVSVISKPEFQVKTKSENSFNQILQQRSRWIGKINSVGDKYALFLAASQMLISILYLPLLIYGILTLPTTFILLFFLIKIGIDQVSLSFYFFRLRLYTEWFFIPIYSLLYPFYSVLLLLAGFRSKQNWKGREIN